MMYKP